MLLMRVGGYLDLSFIARLDAGSESGSGSGSGHFLKVVILSWPIVDSQGDLTLLQLNCGEGRNLRRRTTLLVILKRCRGCQGTNNTCLLSLEERNITSCSSWAAIFALLGHVNPLKLIE